MRKQESAEMHACGTFVVSASKKVRIYLPIEVHLVEL